MTDIRTKIAMHKPNIIALCETWIQDEPLNPKFYPSECLSIEGYNLYRYDNANAIKGGILLYINPDLDGGPCRKMIKEAKSFEESTWHWINVKTGHKDIEKVLFGCVYRKGSSSPTNNERLNELIHKASKMNELVTICGDFNFPSISWDTNMHTKAPNIPDDPDIASTEDLFIATLDEAVLNQYVRSFTRKRGTDKPSLLDLVITDDQQTISNLCVEAPFGKSDHSLVCWNSTFKCTDVADEPEPEPKANFFKGNYNKMRQDLQSVNWESEFDKCEDINDMLSRFEQIIQANITKHVPLQKKSSKTHGNLPWVNYKTSRAIKRKYHAWKRYSETKTHAKYMEYVKERTRVTKKLRQAKREFEKKIAKDCKLNPKAFYRYANNNKCKSTNFIRLKKQTGEYTGDDKDTAEELNNYFMSVFTKDEEHEPLDLSNNIPDANIKMDNIVITKEDVYNLLKKVNPNKSAGDDQIHPRILQECANELTHDI